MYENIRLMIKILHDLIGLLAVWSIYTYVRSCRVSSINTKLDLSV